MKAINLCLFCLLLIGCANKPKQEKVPQTLINNTVGINDTLGLSLHPEFPIYSTKQKQVFYFKGKTKKISRFLQEICSNYGEKYSCNLAADLLYCKHEVGRCGGSAHICGV